MRSFLLATILTLLALAASIAPAHAQSARTVMETYDEGSVWHMIYMRTGPGQQTQYIESLSGVWKQQIELAEEMGFVLDHHVLAKWPASPGDWDVLIIEIFPNMAAYDEFWENWAKVDAEILRTRQQEQEAGERVRAERTMLGVQIAREVLFRE